MEFLFGIFVFYIVYRALKEKYEYKFYALPGCMALLEMLFWLILPIILLLMVVSFFVD
jgi:hypothetical protein